MTPLRMEKTSRLYKILVQEKEEEGKKETKTSGMFQRVESGLRGSFRRMRKRIMGERKEGTSTNDSEEIYEEKELLEEETNLFEEDLFMGEEQTTGRDSAYFSHSYSLSDWDGYSSGEEEGGASHTFSMKRQHYHTPLKVLENRVEKYPRTHHQKLVLQHKTRMELFNMFPVCVKTVEMMFMPNPISTLMNLTSNQVACLLFDLSKILHCSSLPSTPWAETTLCASLSLLYSISCLTSTFSGMKGLPTVLLRLKEKCILNYSNFPWLCWRDTRCIQLHIWHCLILMD